MGGDVTKVSDTSISVSTPRQYEYKELLFLQQVRLDELAKAQANLDAVNDLIKQADDLGVKATAVKV